MPVILSKGQNGRSLPEIHFAFYKNMVFPRWSPNRFSVQASILKGSQYGNFS